MRLIPAFWLVLNWSEFCHTSCSHGNDHKPYILFVFENRQIHSLTKAQFRRRASAVPSLIVIRFNCSTAETRLWFRRRAIVAPNSEFTEATQQLVSGDVTKTMAPLSAPFSKLQRQLLLTSSLNYCKTREEDGKEACRKYFAFASEPSAVIASLFPNYTLVVFRKLHCCTILSTTSTTQLRMVWAFIEYVQWCQVQEDIPRVQDNLQVYSLPHSTQFATPPCFFFWCRLREFFSWSPRNSSRESNPAKIH